MSLDFTNEEKINSPFCKTPEETVTKDVFLRGFELTLKKVKKYNTEYILGIIKKIQDYGVINIEEFKTLREIINNKEFINTAKQVFTRAIIFSGNIEEINEFQESITVEKLVAYLIEYSIIELLKNETDNILDEEGVGKLLYENNGISFYKTSNIGYIVINGLITTKYVNLDLEYVEETGLVTAEVKGKGKILINTKGEQVSPDGVYYNNIDLGFVKETGLIFVDSFGEVSFILDNEGKQVSTNGYNINLDYLITKGLIIVEILGKGEIILNKDLEQISPEGIFYHEIAIFEDNNFIAAYTKKGAVILDNKGKQISPNGEFYCDIATSYLENTGLIIAEVGGKGKVILDNNGIQISPEGTYYEVIDLSITENTGLIRAEIKDKGETLLNKEGKPVSSDGTYYNSIDVSYIKRTGLFIAYVKGKGRVVLDSSGIQISPEGTYYKSIDVSLLYNTGLIMASTKELHYLLDRKGNVVNTSKKEFEYGHGENQFFTKGLFGKKTYYPNQD